MYLTFEFQWKFVFKKYSTEFNQLSIYYGNYSMLLVNIILFYFTFYYKLT